MKFLNNSNQFSHSLKPLTPSYPYPIPPTGPTLSPSLPPPFVSYRMSKFLYFLLIFEVNEPLYNKFSEPLKPSPTTFITLPSTPYRASSIFIPHFFSLLVKISPFLSNFSYLKFLNPHIFNFLIPWNSVHLHVPTLYPLLGQERAGGRGQGACTGAEVADLA